MKKNLPLEPFVSVQFHGIKCIHIAMQLPSEFFHLFQLTLCIH